VYYLSSCAKPLKVNSFRSALLLLHTGRGTAQEPVLYRFHKAPQLGTNRGKHHSSNTNCLCGRRIQILSSQQIAALYDRCLRLSLWRWRNDCPVKCFALKPAISENPSRVSNEDSSVFLLVHPIGAHCIQAEKRIIFVAQRQGEVHLEACVLLSSDLRISNSKYDGAGDLVPTNTHLFIAPTYKSVELVGFHVPPPDELLPKQPPRRRDCARHRSY
jgi:hypothetical protein